MLILTPTPLQTAAERAFFAELATWDTGSGVRGAVVASLPLVEGPMSRRQSDAVLFVPEGVAVLRIVEVERQSGVVTASPEGAWTIGPGDGPGDVLQLSGGGSTPLEGLMRAGMHAAVTLRRAGLEPGRIARLTVLTGAVTGLLPADGDLGEGDQVATLDSRSLLLGIGRASRHAGTDNPRLWTTADVRAGIEALGVAGRTPSVEELNGEGFPYSPYVLRRPDLLTPAALNAAPNRVGAPTTGSTPAVPGPASSTALPVAPAGPLVDPAAAARVAAAAVQAQEAAERDADEASAAASPETAAPAPPPGHTLVPPAAGPASGVRPAVGPPSAERPAVRQPLPTARAGDTLALTAEPAPRTDTGTIEPATIEPGVVEPRPAAEDTGGLAGLFGDPVPDEPAPRRELPAELRPRLMVEQPPVPPRAGASASGGGGRRRGVLLAVVGLVLVAAAAVGLVVLLGDRDDGGGGSATAGSSSSAPATPTEPAGPAVGDTEQVNGVTYTLQVIATEPTCTGHAYGPVADYFATADCTSLTRSLWSADSNGQPAVVSVSAVEMPDPASAQALRSLADTDGSGNVSDLLREGVRYPGSPAELRNAQYASSQTGSTVTIVESSWAGPGGSSTSALDALASSALSLPAATSAD